MSNKLKNMRTLDYNKRFAGCLSPVYIADLKRGGRVLVKCNKCMYCRMVRQYDLIGRIEREHLNPRNKLCLFLTLDYNNENVPRYHFDGSRGFWYSTRSELKNGSGDSRYPTLSIDEVDEFYNLVGLEHLKTFGHLCSVDLSDYFKKVSTYISRDIKQNTINYFQCYEQIKFRYFACGEYGPTTFRPHYHAVLWFPDYYTDEQLGYIYEKLSTCWSFGSVVIETVDNGGVTKYLSSYLNSFFNLPKVLQSKYTRPFCIFTKMPVVGSYEVDEKEIYEILTTGVINRVRWNDKKKSFDDERLSLTFFRRYFPKCRGFSYFDNRKRVFAYSYVYNYIKENWPSSAISKLKTFKDFDKIKLSDIEFPTVYNERLRTFEEMPYQDKHASIICAMYCFVFDLTPEYVLSAFERLYSQMSLKSLGKYFESQNEMFENQKDIRNTHSDEI